MARPRKPEKVDDAVKRLLEEYREKYNLDEINPNDLASLRTMITNQLVIDKSQEQLRTMLDSGEDFNPAAIKRIQDTVNTLITANIKIESSLGIDRKSRRTDGDMSPVEYIIKLKQTAREFLNNDQRILKVYCKRCKIMVGRVSGVYDTTEYHASFQCPQCRKHITVSRKERDVFFDVRDAAWRRKYPIVVEQPQDTETLAPEINADPDLIIGDLGVEVDE